MRNKIAILAMTKTGSTALEAELAPDCDIVFRKDPRIKHMQLRKFERFMRPYLTAMGAQNVETCCLFREPVEWLGSWFRYRGRPELSGKANSTAGMTFDAFVSAYLSEQPPPFAKVGRQSAFVLNKDDQIGVDHLFSYADMDGFLRFLSSRFERTIRLERMNVSPHRDLELSGSLAAELRRVCALDFEIYQDLKGKDDWE